MYAKIMVPLDGSELAECVFPHLETIAKGCGVKNVILVRAVEPFYVPQYVYASVSAPFLPKKLMPKTRHRLRSISMGW